VSPADNRNRYRQGPIDRPRRCLRHLDIDDTIKITNVGHRETLIANTFLNPYRPVPGMAKLYRQWQSKGIVFHYVSAGPWPLYGPLSDFLTAAGFPKAPSPAEFPLETDSSLLDLTSSPEAYKLQTIEAIFKDFPARQFLLIGDSGERDPEIYGRLARTFPARSNTSTSATSPTPPPPPPASRTPSKTSPRPLDPLFRPGHRPLTRPHSGQG